MNQTPLVLQPTNPDDPDLAFVLDAEIAQLSVVARDPDPDDRVYFVWVTPNGSRTEVIDDQTVNPDDPDEVLYLSVLTMERDPALDGREVRCLVTDAEASVELVWKVEVPQ